MHDVVVVGAGPAGSTTARYTAQRGLRTLVLERRKTIGFPVQCGEYMASDREVEALFPLAGDVGTLFDLPEALKEARTRVIRIFSPSGRSYDVPFEGYTVSRDKVDPHWARLAEREGAEILTDCRVRRVRGNAVETSRGTFGGRVVVGADGPRSTVSQSVGLNAPSPLAAAVTCEVEGSFGDSLDIYFGRLAPGGYAWVIPKDGAANVGLGVWPKHEGRLDSLLQRFLDRMGFATDGWTGGWVPEMGSVSRTVKENVLLVGDAAGHVMPTNGGGVNTAMVCARIAGNLIADHLQNGGSLETYERAWRAAVGGALDVGVRIRKVADLFFPSDFWLERIMRVLGPRPMATAIRCEPFLSWVRP
ncbi:MAG: geranylgeranyl reductase family protein [Thermoplasmata archaeon]